MKPQSQPYTSGESASKMENVYSDLENRILHGGWAVGFCLPTEIELSAEFQCSRSTVSKAIARLAHDGLVERRKRAGTRVIRNTANRNRAPLELDAFAFIYPSNQHEGIWRIVKGFQGAAQQLNRRVVTLTTGIDKKKEAEFLNRLAEFDVRGVVIYPVVHTPKDQAEFSRILVESKFPIILADRYMPGVRCCAVTVDNFHAGYTMTRHLLDKGLNQIGFFTNDAWAPSISERYKGYVWANKEAGKHINPEAVLLEPEMCPNFDDRLRDPIQLGHQYLGKKPDVEGVVCGNDNLARGLVRAAQAIGLSVPDDIKITGIDNFTNQSEEDIPLTTYNVPFEEIGRKCFDVLNAKLHSDSIDVPDTQIRGSLIIRKSS